MQVHRISSLLAIILLAQGAHGGARKEYVHSKFDMKIRPDLDAPDRGVDFDMIDSNRLAGLRNLNFNQYSGYLSKGQIHTHYWFVESQDRPLEAPVLVWLNGGPGVSGLNALFYENGPFKLQSYDKSLKLREFTWNKFANILYLDSPSGVGFSYQTSGEKGVWGFRELKSSPGSDEATNLLNYHALKKFFDKFPEFNKNPLYLMGQGYGGVYALGLAQKINEFRAFPNLAGIAIGNGFLHANLLAKASVFHARDRGLIDDDLWKHVSQFCCRDVEPTRDTCIMRGPLVRPECLVLVNGLFLDLNRNPYNTQQECSGRSSSEVVFEGELAPVRSSSGRTCPARYKTDGDNHLPEFLDDFLDDARRNLNIPSPLWDGVKWKARGDLIGYNQTHAYEEEGLAAQMKTVLANKIPVMLYHGDSDMVCPSLGNEWFVEEAVGLQVTERYKPWKVDKRTVGYKKQYGSDLTFVIVEGAGHSAPMDKPREVFELIKKFISETSGKDE